MNGLEGNDVMSGNSGTDIADGEKDDNTISGGDNSDQITGGPYKVVIYGGGGDEHIAHNEFAINPDDIIKPDGSRDKIDFTADFVVFQSLGVSVSFVEPTFDIYSFFY
jgi:Ca2+-binding RTX toxin-like protein